MKNLFHYSLVLFVSLFSIALTAQEDIEVTESSEPIDDFYIDDIITPTLIFENKVLPFEHVREADIAWQKRIWRVIDVREKMNLPWQHPDQHFFGILKEHIDNGDIKAFSDEKFKDELLANDLANILSRVDTFTYYDEDTYEESIKIVQNDINPADIKRYRVKEIWFFDEQASRMKVRIIGIAPIKDLEDDDGNYLGELPLFWVYYPEARDFLSRHRVVNGFNDMAPMTWQELLETRFFASYIVKESNPLDLRIKDMYPDDELDGITRLLESERIKNELFNFEHDLWEY